MKCAGFLWFWSSGISPLPSMCMELSVVGAGLNVTRSWGRNMKNHMVDLHCWTYSRESDVRNAVRFSLYYLVLSILVGNKHQHSTTINNIHNQFITIHLLLGGIHQLISFHTTFHRSTQVFAECQRDTSWWIFEAWWDWWADWCSYHLGHLVCHVCLSWLTGWTRLGIRDLFCHKTIGAKWL